MLELINELTSSLVRIFMNLQLYVKILSRVFWNLFLTLYILSTQWIISYLKLIIYLQSGEKVRKRFESLLIVVVSKSMRVPWLSAGLYTAISCAINLETFLYACTGFLSKSSILLKALFLKIMKLSRMIFANKNWFWKLLNVNS